MYKKRNNKKYLIVIVVFIFIIFSLIILSKTVLEERKLLLAECFVKDTSLFFNKVVLAPINFTKKQIEKSLDKKTMFKEMEQLKEKANNYDLLESKKMELEYQLKEMQEILDLTNVLTKSSYLNATVINRNIGLWYNTITIDKGQKNGIVFGMPVIVEKGLIGRVVKTSNFNSTVKLLTSDEIVNKISVKIKNNDDYIFGLLVGYNQKEQVFIVEGIDENVEIEAGSLVTTTGLGNYFPSGIIVGKVKQVKTDNFDLAKIIEVASEVDFNNINYVTVLKRESP